MKTIFDKIDTRYLDCTTGVCDHVMHNMNATIIVGLAILIITCKYTHNGHQEKNRNKN